MGYGQYPSDFSSAKAFGKASQDRGENRRLILRKDGPAFPGFPLTGYAIWQASGPIPKVAGHVTKQGRRRKSFVKVVRFLYDRKGCEP